MNLNTLNKYIKSFFAKHEEDELSKAWMEKANQKGLRKVCKTAENNSRKKKDPNAPKRPKSAYMCFCDVNRSKVRDDLGTESKTTDVTRELGKRWNLLKANVEKGTKKAKTAMAKHEKAHLAAKARYAKEMETYVPSPEVKEQMDRKKKAKSGPKNAKSAYMHFCDKYRKPVKEELGDVKVTEVTRELGKRWNLLKADDDRSDEMDELKDLAAEDKKRYTLEKAAFLKSEGVEVKAATKKAATKKAKTDDKPKPKPRKVTPYAMFCKEQRPEMKSDNPDLTSKQITAELSKQWKEMSAEEKAEY